MNARSVEGTLDMALLVSVSRGPLDAKAATAISIGLAGGADNCIVHRNDVEYRFRKVVVDRPAPPGNDGKGGVEAPFVSSAQLFDRLIRSEEPPELLTSPGPRGVAPGRECGTVGTDAGLYLPMVLSSPSAAPATEGR
jgi:hypothetical protein